MRGHRLLPHPSHWPDRIPAEALDEMCGDPRRFGFHWNAECALWERRTLGGFDRLHAPEPLPFFLDPRQIEDLTPEIDWSRRVGDRVRSFLEWGRAGDAAPTQS